MNTNVSRGWSRMLAILLSLLLLVSGSLPALAEAVNKEQSAKDPNTVTIKVLEVTNAREKNNDRAGIGDNIIVKVDSLKSLLSLAGNNLDKIRLTINGQKINPPAPIRTGDANTLQYTIARDKSNTKVLESLFHAKMFQMVTNAPVSLSIDDPVNNKIFLDVWPGSFKLVRPSHFNGMLFGVGLVLFAFSFLKLGKLDARLRDYGPDSTFSLSLVQMAIWYYVVTVSFIYLYVASGGCMPTLNDSTLVLLGISSATAISGKIINVSNTEQKKKDANGKALVTEENEGESEGFFLDILSDEYGINLTRFQHVVWTFIMVGIFIFTVVTESTIPDFTDSNLLLLMGISSGSYLAYKLKEAPPPQPKKSAT